MVAPAQPDVLLVDDDADVRRSLGRALQRAGYTVQPAKHGADALEKVAAHQFAVVVCDLMMPVMDGMRLYESLQADHPHTAARVLFITGCAHDTRVRQFLRRTDRPILLKPFDMAAFLDEVGHVAQGKPRLGGRAPAASYSPEEIARIHEMIFAPGIDVACPRCGEPLAMSAPPSAETAVMELRCERCGRSMIVRASEGER